ncbi:peptide ABC transporter substrate-binding protein [Tistrella bauzanensis]|uniref:Peptide ABC transporter substrate-binding protein n=1 Tax=Tistrella bauzanensis TaxID=657419 RepID=A0ABQ1J9J8_9PROT|nr:peptide ABC transporter substrate-binding protein [Tistrella bauzanensis]
MKHLRTTKRLLLSAALAAALPLGMTAGAQAAGSLTLSSPQDPGSWDPIDTFLVNWSSVATNIYDGLVYRGPDLKLQPALATEWQVLDEGKRLRFKLREGVTFHNGEPFNANAVKFTFDRLLGEDGKKGPQRSNYTVIDRINIIDDTTVDFVLKQPDPVLLTKLSGYGAMIMPPKYVAEHDEAYVNANPVGTGPFRMTAYDPKVSVTLEAFADHWGGAPKLDTVTYRFIPEPATAVAELQAGRVDIVVPPTIPISMVDTIKADDRLEVVSVTSPTVYALRFNTRDGITADARVRKALIMAVDRKTIIDAILGGQASQIASFQSELSFGYDPAMKPLAYDPEAAKALLKEAGVAPGAAVQIDIRGNDATFAEVSQAVASYLGMVGVTATIKPYETNVLLNDIIPQGKSGAMFQQKWGGWTLDYDNTAYLMYHTGERWNPYDSDPKLDALLERQRSMTDPAAREKVLQGIAAYAADRALEMPLFNLNEIFGVSKRVKGFVAPPDNRIRLTDVTVD